MTKHKPDGLKSKVLKLSPKFFKKDFLEEKPYLPFCNYQIHRGLIKKEEVCQARECKHYFKLYLSGEKQFG